MRDFDGSYLLRVWRDGRGDDAWRASLRDLRSQETTTFHTLAALAEHLADFGSRVPGDDDEP
jgi:hypothetical protein